MRNLAKGIHISQPLAAVVQGNLRGVKGDAPAGIQNCGIGMDPLEIVQPELHGVIARIVFDEAQLGPSHRPVVPGGRPWTGRSGRKSSGLRVGLPVKTDNAGCGEARGLFEERSSSAFQRMPPDYCGPRPFYVKMLIMSVLPPC